MLIDDATVMIDCCTRLNHSLVIAGWAHRDNASLEKIIIEDRAIVAKMLRVGLYHGGVASLGDDKGFDIHVILMNESFPDDASLTFQIGGVSFVVRLAELLSDAQSRQATLLSTTFHEMANAPAIKSILDVGGRARSQVDRSLAFPGKEVTVLDVLPGDNVTVVGDAHAMSSLLPRDHFDAFLSVSVFEHLLMPWKVALEINHVLKFGGFGLVHTHQTLGMHDMPWDFWRFSDTAWDAIFNRFTGFEIVERVLTHPSYILPVIYRDDKAMADKARGFEGSSVLVRKIGVPSVTWDVQTEDVVPTIYPSH